MLHVEDNPVDAELIAHAFKDAGYDVALTRVETQGMGRSKMHVLEALLRLRQAACHPGLLDALIDRARESACRRD